jgi:DNA polymerase-3 subunit delta'
MSNGGLYAPPPGSEAIYVGAVRSILRAAAMSPALGRRKVFVIGDAERMAPQDGAETAANAFLKLLEEPLADTTIVLTSSVPGSLLPTIRSRVVAVRVPYVVDDAVRAFVRDPAVAKLLEDREVPSDVEALIRLAGGAPGTLLAQADASTALARADRLFEAATRPRAADRYALALSAGAAKARGSFSETLDALAATVHRRTRQAVDAGQPGRALSLSTTLDAVNRSTLLAAANVNPQLITASLLGEMAEALDE